MSERVRIPAAIWGPKACSFKDLGRKSQEVERKLSAIRSQFRADERASLGRRIREMNSARGGDPNKLFSDGVGKKFLVHRLVAAAFIGPNPPGLEVNHKDGDKSNARAENLEYVTRSENHRHAFRLGLAVPGPGRPDWAMREGRGVKLTIEQVREIRRKFAAGSTRRELCAEFKVGKTAVKDVLSRKTWKTA